MAADNSDFSEVSGENRAEHEEAVRKPVALRGVVWNIVAGNPEKVRGEVVSPLQSPTKNAILPPPSSLGWRPPCETLAVWVTSFVGSNRFFGSQGSHWRVTLGPRRLRRFGKSGEIMRLKVGDVVQVVAGDDKGTRGKVVRTDREKNKIVVEGVNRAYKHVKRGHPKAPQGGRLSIEMPISASNAMLIDPTTDKPTRTHIQLPKTKDEPKQLVAKSGAVLRRIGKDNSEASADN